jgi:hypothetical protein
VAARGVPRSSRLSTGADPARRRRGNRHHPGR